MRPANDSAAYLALLSDFDEAGRRFGAYLTATLAEARAREERLLAEREELKEEIATLRETVPPITSGMVRIWAERWIKARSSAYDDLRVGAGQAFANGRSPAPFVRIGTPSGEHALTPNQCRRFIDALQDALEHAEQWGR